MNIEQAHKLGYEVVRGAYHGTTDDRADGWYIQDTWIPLVDRRGPGYRTRQDALDALEDALSLSTDRTW